MAKSNKSRPSRKPSKPRPDFPLFPHGTGYWCKKVKGRFHYFGKVADDPKGVAALDRWLDKKTICSPVENYGPPAMSSRLPSFAITS